jgi:signal peptidase I
MHRDRVMVSDNHLDLEHGTVPESADDQHGYLVGQLLKTVLFALILFLLARLVLLPYEVDGRSMSPNLVDSERVLVNRAVYSHLDLNHFVGWIPGFSVSDTPVYIFHSPRRGDVLVLNPPQYSAEPFIKRVIGVAGDHITVKEGFVFINGAKLAEPYVVGPITSCMSDLYCADFVVPDGYIYVMGDNREQSFDSRAFGPVPLDNVIGKAWFSNWPIDRVGRIPT